MRRDAQRRDAAAEITPKLGGRTLVAPLIELYLKSAEKTLKPSTVQPYRSHLRALVPLVEAKVAADARAKRRASGPLTLADLTKDNIQAVVNDLVVEHLSSARGKAIAARAFATDLAEQGKWFLGDGRLPLSVLYRLEIPEEMKKGRPAFSDDDLWAIRDAAGQHPTRPHFHLAVQYLGELGPRAGFEVMTLRLADVHLPRFAGDRGYIEVREKNTKTAAGARQIPLESSVSTAIDGYLRFERRDFQGDDPDTQPLFLTEGGRAFAYSGWNSMRQRFRRFLAAFDPQVRYQASRNRGTRTVKLRAKGYEDSQILQLMGWTSVAMIARYAGPIPLEELQRKPGTTDLRPKLRRVG